MSVGSDEFPETPEDRLVDAMVKFTGCIGEALEGICSYGWTIGETYVPFDPDPDDECEVDEDSACEEQAWVRITSIAPSPTSVESFDGTSCVLELSLGLEVGILRCMEIPEGGEAPTASDVLLAAMQSVNDMNNILCAALGCEAWSALNVGTWTPDGPLGGQYGGIWTFTAEL